VPERGPLHGPVSRDRLAIDALDKVRREVWNAARRGGHKQRAIDLKQARWALWKGAENLTDKQRARLGWVEKTNLPLYQAHTSALAPFRELAKSIAKHFEAILSSLVHDLSNARIESLNTRIRLLTRRAFGFHSAAPLIGMAILSFGRLQLALPGRA